MRRRPGAIVVRAWRAGLLDWPVAARVRRGLVLTALGGALLAACGWVAIHVGGMTDLLLPAVGVAGGLVMVAGGAYDLATRRRAVVVRLDGRGLAVADGRRRVACRWEDFVPAAAVGDGEDEELGPPDLVGFNRRHELWLRQAAWAVLRRWARRRVRGVAGPAVVHEQPAVTLERLLDTAVCACACGAVGGVIGLAASPSWLYLMDLDDGLVTAAATMSMITTLFAIAACVAGIVTWRQRGGWRIIVTPTAVVVEGPRRVRLRRPLVARPQSAGRWLVLSEVAPLGRRSKRAKLWLPMGRRRHERVAEDVRRALGFLPADRGFEVLPAADAPPGAA